MIDKLKLEIPYMLNDAMLANKINEIIDKLNSMEESVSSHVELDSDDKPKFETYYCPKCNEYVYSKDFEQEHFCISEQSKEEKKCPRKDGYNECPTCTFYSDTDGKCYYKPKEENQKSLLEQANDKARILINTSGDCNEIEEVIDLFNQYAKEAEKKIKK